MEHPTKYLDDDKHLCIRCKNTIIGLDNYVLHRKNECREPYSSSPTDLAHLTRDSEVNERYGITEKAQVETDRVSETFSDDVIDLSTTTKRNFHSAGHSTTILFPSTSSLDSNSEQKDSNKLCKTYTSESYAEHYGDIDAYQNHFISSRDQSIFMDYRNSGNDQTRKEMFATPNNYSSSSDIFHQEHQETTGISLFRSFESFNESFKNNQDIVHGNYLSQTASKYMGEVNNFDNKSPEIYSVSEAESFLGNETHPKTDPYKSKLLSNSMDEADRQSFQKQNYYEEEITKTKVNDSNIPECNTKNSCSNDAVDFSKQDIRQNDFLSSLELTSNVTKKIMKYELDMEDDEEFDDSRPPSHYTGGKWPPGTDPHLREPGKWIFSPRSVEEDCHDDFDELNDNAIEHQSFQPPPPSYTKGKWLPGKRMADSNKYDVEEDNEGKPYNRNIKGKPTFEKQISSDIHLGKKKNFCKREENNLESLNKRPLRATKQQAQIFLKQKISLLKNMRNKRNTNESFESDVPESKMKVKTEEKIAPSIYVEKSDESDPDEMMDKKKCPKTLCPICRLSFSNIYSSQHFASLAHIHNELEFNEKPNTEIRKKYNKIILKNIEPFIKTSYFFCKPCKFYTNSHDDLEVHFNYHEDESQFSQTKIIYSCTACPDETDLYSLNDLKRHLQVAQHKKNVRYEIFQAHQIVLTYNIEILCILCNRAFRFNKAYQNHRRVFHEEKSFQLVNQRLSQCPECSYQGTTERIVREHLKKDHNINCSSTYFCFVCGLKFDTSSQADSHRHSVDHRIMIDKHKGKPNERTCNICYKEVANISILRQHMNNEHRKELTPCVYCGLVFPLRADLTAHRKNCPRVVALLDGIYKCDLCSFSNDLFAHVLMHTLLVHFEKEEAELYSCHICKTRMQGRSMKNHMLLHTKELKYSCVHCSRRFSEEKWLEQHLSAVHSSLVKRKRCGRAENRSLSSDVKGMDDKNVQKSCKRFLCEICGRTYGSKSHLKRHQNEQHVEGIVAMETESLPINTKIDDNKQASSSKSLMCEVCGVLFGNSTLLKIHRQKHRNNGDGGETYPCPHCSYSTPRIHHLKRHLRLHTGATPFQCSYCSYKANNQENLRKHMLKTQRHFGRFMYECQLCLQNNPGQKEEQEEGRVSPEIKRKEETEAEPEKEGVSCRPFGCNFASAFKKHLISKHRSCFRDKEEISRHIRSYYNEKSDSTFTENPKLFKYKFKKRVRKSKSGNHTSSSNVDEKLLNENNYISEDIKPFGITHQHLNQFNIDINRQGEPLREQIPSSDLSSFLPSSGTNIISSDVTLNVNEMRVLTTYSEEKMLSLPSCSYKGEEKVQVPPQTKRVRLFINKESKKTYILKNDVTDELKEDFNIPIGAEVILRDSQQETSNIPIGDDILRSNHQEIPNISLTEQLQTNFREKESLCVPQVSVGVQGLCSDSWHHDGHVWVQQEEKVQNVVSKKLYLLVSNEKNIETQIKDILPSLQ